MVTVETTGPELSAEASDALEHERELGFPDRVRCPFCDEEDTELYSTFGSALSVATYRCNRCRTAFEWVKWDD